MIQVGSPAPQFDGSAVIERRQVRLRWEQIHENRTLILMFDAFDGTAWSLDQLVAVGNTLTRPDRPRANVALICHNDLFDILAWAGRRTSEGGPGAVTFPLIADPDGHIAALYGLCGVDRGPLRGHCLIDSSGTVRELAVSDFSLAPGVEELIRSIQATGYPADRGLLN
jgi:peroxiredoxin (alkyl hydroperoxide reductase subunit C)